MNSIPKLILAPMAGITDLPFRLICKELGADILSSEMLSSTGLHFTLPQNIKLVNSYKQDFPFVIQLFGNNPEYFVSATKIIDNLPRITEIGESSTPRRPEGIDINFGCPVKKVMKQQSGCALMRDPKHAHKIIKAVVDNTSLPVSIKIRAGIDNTTAFDFLEEVADLDWKTIMIHGRTFKEGFSGNINHDLIKQIKKKYPKKEIIANGGILTPELAKEILEKTNADGLGIARGCLGNPWLFKQIKEYLTTGKYSKPTLEEVKKVAIKHCELIQKYKSANNIVEMRKHLGWYFKGFPAAKKLRAELFQVENIAQIKTILAKF